MGHHQVVRPPTVARLSRSRSADSARPACGVDELAGCTPPCSRARRWLGKATVEAVELVGGRSSAGRRGDIFACQRVSSASRLPTPATTDWSRRRALTGAMTPAEPTDELGKRDVLGVGSEWLRSGSSRTRRSRRLSNRARDPPSAKVRVERSQTGRRGPGAFRRLGGEPVATLAGRADGPGDHHVAAHAEVDGPPSGQGCGPATPEVSHQIDLPCRFATVSVRPTRARRISPGACGRQT